MTNWLSAAERWINIAGSICSIVALPLAVASLVAITVSNVPAYTLLAAVATFLFLHYINKARLWYKNRRPSGRFKQLHGEIEAAWDGILKTVKPGVIDPSFPGNSEFMRYDAEKRVHDLEPKLYQLDIPTPKWLNISDTSSLDEWYKFLERLPGLATIGDLKRARKIVRVKTLPTWESVDRLDSYGSTRIPAPVLGALCALAIVIFGLLALTVLQGRLG